MELLIKSFENTIDPNKPKIDFRNYLKTFGIGQKSSNKKNHQLLINLAQNDTIFLADILASQIATLYKKNYFKQHTIVKDALNCCRDILQDQEFKSRSYEELNIKKLSNEVIVVGCQDRDLLYERVRATVDICKHLINSKHNKINIYFSGKYPKRKRVSILNEAEEMRRLFHEIIERKKFKSLFKDAYKIIIEDNSDNTIQNIKNIALKLKKTKNCNIILVSSSFHIPRLYTVFSEEILQNKNIDTTIKNIVLVGSEGYSNDKPYEEYQIKLLLFEIYRYLLNNEQFYELYK